MASPSSPVLNSELVVALKRLKLGRIADTLPERLVLADKQEMTFDDLLLLVLTDEIARRDNTAAELRASEARLDPAMRLETWAPALESARASAPASARSSFVTVFPRDAGYVRTWAAASANVRVLARATSSFLPWMRTP